MAPPHEAVRVGIPTLAGEFEVRAFESSSGNVYLALVRGDLGDGRGVLARLHSECLTGDVLGSLRCDCGVQLRAGLHRVAAEGRGVVLYLTGQEGRGVGLVNKLRAYVLQDDGLDTLDANRGLGLPVDARRYDEAADVLRELGVRSVRLLTNNPAKVAGLRDAGLEVAEVIPIRTTPHARNLRYLRTKQERLGHVSPAGEAVEDGLGSAPDVTRLLGPVRPRADRPYVVAKYAQTLDGRIATVTGDSKWISGEDERRLSHALRAAADAVLVGAGTVLRDDPRLTVRMVAGASPIRVVLDSRLRTPLSAHVLDGSVATTVFTSGRSSPARRRELRERGIVVNVVPNGPAGLDLSAVLRSLRGAGVASLLVEGGARVLTSFLSRGVVDRLVVGIAPRLIGAGTEALGDLGVRQVTEGLRLDRRTSVAAGQDLLVAGDVVAPEPAWAEDASPG